MLILLESGLSWPCHCELVPVLRCADRRKHRKHRKHYYIFGDDGSIRKMDAIHLNECALCGDDLEADAEPLGPRAQDGSILHGMGV